MKKLCGVSIILLFFCMIIFPSSGIQINIKPINSSVRGNALYVGGLGPGNYSKIQDAIDNASDGDTVFVYDDSSPYYENVVVDKSIKLIGEEKNTTIIDGDNKGNVIYIPGNQVVIAGFTIQNSSIPYSHRSGISVDSNNYKIVDNIIKNNFIGINGDGTKNFTIQDNIIIYNEYGIKLGYGYAWGKITNNIIAHNNNHGIFLSNTAGIFLVIWNIIADNGKIDTAGTGIYKYGSDAVFHHNDFHLNNHNAKVDIVPKPNSWDDGSEGNYWDDWEENVGFPNNYIIGGFNVDFHPNEISWMDSFFVGSSEGNYYALTNKSINFKAETTVDSYSVSWFWDFGDGNKSDVISPTHSYSASGLYQISVTITDISGRSDTSKALTHIGSPYKPDITGPIKGTLGVSYDYTFVAIDPDSDDVYYRIDWYSDGQEYLYGPYKSGEEAIISHTWYIRMNEISAVSNDIWIFKIRAKTIDIHDLESDYSEFTVTMPRDKSIMSSLFLRFLERYPLLERVILYLIK